MLKYTGQELSVSQFHCKFLNFDANGVQVEQKTLFAEVIGMIKSLLASIMPEEQVVEVLEQFNLSMALILIKTDMLEKRLKALKLIKKVIERTKKPEEKKFGAAFTDFLRGKEKAAEENAKSVDPK